MHSMKDKILIACLAVYTVLTTLLIFSVPIGSTPDETAHLEYIMHLTDTGTLPVFKPLGANAPGYEFHQPPLYYAVCAVVWKVLPRAAQSIAARFVSLLCGVLTLVLLWHSVRLLFPDDKVLARYVTGFGALWPLHIGVGASAANDAMAGLMCAGVFWAMARVAVHKNSKYSWREAGLLGLFFGLGMLTKSSSLPVGVAGIGALFHLSRRWSAPIAARNALIACAAALLLCGAWLMRNTMLYGDPLAMRVFDEAFRNSSPSPQALMAALNLGLFEYLRGFLLILFSTFWGLFGGPNTAIKVLNPFGRGMAPEALTFLPFFLLCLVAAVVIKWGFIKWWIAQTLEYSSRIALLWWAIGYILLVLVLMRFNLNYFQAQARYLHPAALSISLFIVLGWRQILGNSRAFWIMTACFGALLVSITLLNVLVWRTLV